MAAEKTNTVQITSGSVEYDLGIAAVPIDDLIEALTAARDEDGAEYVVGLSGNDRGAKWMQIHTEPDMVGWT
jgi:hypothetical protein